LWSSTWHQRADQGTWWSFCQYLSFGSGLMERGFRLRNISPKQD
jgi:hypothetical protein